MFDYKKLAIIILILFSSCSYSVSTKTSKELLIDTYKNVLINSLEDSSDKAEVDTFINDFIEIKDLRLDKLNKEYKSSWWSCEVEILKPSKYLENADQGAAFLLGLFFANESKTNFTVQYKIQYLEDEHEDKLISSDQNVSLKEDNISLAFKYYLILKKSITK